MLEEGKLCPNLSLSRAQIGYVMLGSSQRESQFQVPQPQGLSQHPEEPEGAWPGAVWAGDTLQSQPGRGDRLTHHGRHSDLLPGQAAKALRRRSQGQHGPCVTPEPPPVLAPAPERGALVPCCTQQLPGDRSPQGPLCPPPAPHHLGVLQGRQKALKSDQEEE